MNSFFNTIGKFLKKLLQGPGASADSKSEGHKNDETRFEVPALDSEGDYEILPEESEPENLKRKWEADELEEAVRGTRRTNCPGCGHEVDASSLTCLFCGARVFQESGFLGRLAHLFRRDPWMSLIFFLFLLLFLYLSLG